MKFRHIINPVNVNQASDLFIAQPITFASLTLAKQMANEQGIQVDLCYTCYPEDRDVAPHDFRDMGILDRSILDVGHFSKPRKLPLIADIIKKTFNGDSANYIIYTNVDIAVKPEFYIQISRLIETGFDAFTINRRTIPGHYRSPDDLLSMFKEIGVEHPGHDCFVFPQNAVKQFNLGLGCIGANWIGRILLSNVMAFSTKFKIFEDEFLTFHIGDDRSWKIEQFNDYDSHNERELIDVLHYLLPRCNDSRQSTELQEMLNFHTNNQLTSIRIAQHRVHRNYKYDKSKLLGDSYKGSSLWEQSLTLNQSPIFVVGYPRSGTTLLQTKLMTQLGIISLPETHFFTIVRGCLHVENDIISPSCLNNVFSKLRERLPFSIEAEHHLVELAKKNQLSPKMLFEAIVVDNLLDNYSLGTIQSSVFIEKTPDHVLMLDVIFRFYPMAKVINIVRHPEKAIFSRRENFPGEDTWDISTHTYAWKKSIRCAEKSTKKQSILTIRFEDLISKEVEVMQKICDFICISFDVSTLSESAKSADLVALPWESWKAINKQQMSEKIIERRSNHLSDTEKRVIQLLASKELKAYNYELNIKDSKYPNYRKDKNILIFSHVPSHPQTHGNSKRVFSMASYLRFIGYRVYFVYYNIHPSLTVDYSAMLETWDKVHVIHRHSPVPTSADGYYNIDDIYEDQLGREVLSCCTKYNIDSVLCNYVFFSKLFSVLPENITKILDTHDRFTDRHLKLRDAGIDKELWWYSFKEKEEAKGLNRADIVLAIQKNEADAFSKITNAQVRTAQHLESQKNKNRVVTGVKTIGFIGSANPVNVSAINSFIETYTSRKDIVTLPSLLVAGSVCNEVDKTHAKVICLGQVEDLDDFYSKVDLVIVPLLFGTGLKIKMVEAMSYGLPIIATSIGAEGLRTKHPMLHYTSMDDLTAAVCKLARTECRDKLQELQSHIIKLFNQYEQDTIKQLSHVFKSDHNSLRAKPSSANLDPFFRLDNNSMLKRFRKFLVDKAPPLLKLTGKVLFVGHGFHQKTGSADFFKRYLKKIFTEVTFYSVSPHKEDANYPDTNLGNYDITFFWQIMPEKHILQYIETSRIICIPMYDATGVYSKKTFDPVYWEPFLGYSFICFCRLLHEQLKTIGASSFHLQYASNNVSIPNNRMTTPESQKPRVLFLYRKNEIPWKLVRELISPSSVESVHIHNAVDPKQTFVPPSSEDMAKYNITISDWFPQKKGYLNLLQSADVFIAPRKFEGIGMAVLDAMDHGLCVVAPNKPTANEYITHGVTGVLYDINTPSIIDLTDCKAIGSRAKSLLAKIEKKYELDSKYLRLFLHYSPSKTQADPTKESINRNKTYTSESRILLVFPHNPVLLKCGVHTRFMALLEYFKNRNIIVDILSHSNFVDKWDTDNRDVKRLFSRVYLEDFIEGQKSGQVFKSRSQLSDFAFVSLQKALKRILRKREYDFVVVGYVHWARLIEGLDDNIHKVIMIEDCISKNQSQRHSSKEIYDMKSSLSDEAKRIDLFDTAIFISSDELQDFSQRCQNAKFIHVPHVIESSTNETDRTSKYLYDLVFVGSDNPFNVAGMKWFLENVMPLFSGKVTLAIAGSVSDHVPAKPITSSDRSVTLLGYVDDLRDLYSKVRLAICPLKGGTGLKIKVVEALSCGVPVVSLEAGLIGIKGKKGGCVEVSNAQNFQKAINQLLDNPTQYREYSKAAVETVKQNFSEIAVYSTLDRVFLNNK